MRILQFPSLNSEEFVSYLDLAGIYFVMAHDGAVRKKAEEDAYSKREKLILRGMIWWINRHKLNVALINRIEFRDTKVFTMIVEGSMKANVEHFTEEIKKQQAAINKPDSPDFEVAKLDKSWDELSKPAQNLDERMKLVFSSVAVLLQSQAIDDFYASMIVLHALLLSHLSIAQRRMPKITFDQVTEAQVHNALTRFAYVANSLLDDAEWSKALPDTEYESDLEDLVDGRLFKVVVNACRQGIALDRLPAEISDEFAQISTAVKSTCGHQLSLAKPDGESAEAFIEREEPQLSVEDLAVMPFSNTIFDKHLASIKVKGTAKAKPGKALKISKEMSHWHNHKRPLDPKLALAAQKPVSKWKNPLRKNQFYMSEMITYAASLTGASGKALAPETITVGAKKLPKVIEQEKLADDSTAKPEKGKSGGKKAKAPTKAELIIAANKEKKGNTESDKAFAAWLSVMKTFEEITDIQIRYTRAKTYLDGLDSAKTIFLAPDVNAYILQVLLIWWGKSCESNKKNEGYHIAALIWSTINRILSPKAEITKEIAVIVEKIVKLMGLPEAKPSKKQIMVERKLSFPFKFPGLKPEILSIGMTPHEFQLLHYGPYMDRATDAKPDARVASFEPDGWQRKVLDEIDGDRSVFVVAPTSAGKTFISFYAMEKVLRADDEGVLIYVAPTKALVNQIAAEVQARYVYKICSPFGSV